MLLAGFETISFERLFFFSAVSATMAPKKIRRGVAKAARVDNPTADDAPLAHLLTAPVAVEAPMAVDETIPYHIDDVLSHAARNPDGLCVQLNPKRSFEIKKTGSRKSVSTFYPEK